MGSRRLLCGSCLIVFVVVDSFDFGLDGSLPCLGLFVCGCRLWLQLRMELRRKRSIMSVRRPTIRPPKQGCVRGLRADECARSRLSRVLLAFDVDVVFLSKEPCVQAWRAVAFVIGTRARACLTRGMLACAAVFYIYVFFVIKSRL